MLNRKITYGIRALASLARAMPRRLSVAELARSEGIPSKFLAVILLHLRRRGIVHGRRGRVGGYELAVDPRKLSVAEVVESLGGPVFPIACLQRGSGRLPARCQECPRSGPCPAEVALRSADAEVHRVLSSISLSDLVHELEDAEPRRVAPRPFAELGRERSRGRSRLR